LRHAYTTYSDSVVLMQLPLFFHAFGARPVGASVT
jgi:hypothetical protein